MRSFGVRLPILAATAWAGIGLTAFGREFSYSETVYLTPTAATYVLPTSYVTSDTYLVPTAYSFASYLPAAFIEEPVTLASTSYLATEYRVRRGLFGRLRLVERPVLASYATTYLPSSYVVPTYYTTSYRTSSYLPTYYTTSYRTSAYLPTTYTATAFDYPRVWPTSYVRTSAVDCDPVPCDTPALAYRSSTAAVSATPTYTVPRSSVGSKAAPSDVSSDPTIPGSAGPPAGEPDFLSPVTEGAKSSSSSEGRADSPPKPPAVEREKSTAAPVGAGSGGQTPAKAAPGTTNKPAAPVGEPADPGLQPAPIDKPGDSSRQSLRPVFSTPRNLRSELQNVLVGRVESEAGEPLGEVSIAVARTDNQSIRRTGMTNAFGGFAIRLADGEWSVNVRLPSGRFYEVRQVTVKSGKIMDNREQREVRNLIISY